MSTPTLVTRRAPAIVALVAATAFWAGNYIVGEPAVREVDPLSLTFMRWGVAAPILLVLAAAIERPDWRAVLRQLHRLTLQGALGMIGFVLLLYIALEHTTAVSSSLISAVCPVLIAVVAAILLRERLTARLAIGLALGLAGVVLVISKGSLQALASLSFNLGDLLTLAAALCWTAYTIYGRSISGIPPITSVAVQAASVTVLMLPFVAVLGLHVPATATAWGSILFIALLPSVAAYLLWDFALRRMPAGPAGAYLNLITVFVVAFAVIAGTGITPAEAIGGVLVLGGVLLASLPRREK